MSKINNKLKFIILAVILFLISFFIILINGNTYTVRVTVPKKVDNIEELPIELDNDNVKLIDKKINGNEIVLKFKGQKKGHTVIEIKKEELLYTFRKLYVHNFNIISYENYIGKINGDFSILLSIIVLHIYALYLLIKKYYKTIKDNLYQHKNVLYLGLIIFLFVSLFNHFLQVISYNGLFSSLERIIGSASTFSYLLLPVAFITSILITISNISLMKKEGFSIRNMLGIILGLFFVFVTLVPNLLSDFLQTTTYIDVHNEKGIWLYIEKFVDTSIFSVISYLECILIGTIILSIKAASKIPKYDKDYIIILGCKVKKDGTLTKLLQGRVDRAIEFAKLQKEKSKKDIIFIPSGGQGKDETISEAEAMYNYLIKNGIKKKDIIVENKSTSTKENFAYSYKLINDKKAKVAFSTTNYHVFRSGTIASIYDKNIEGIGSKTKSYFFLNAFIREYIAALADQKKKHAFMILFLMLLSFFIIGIIYISVLL